MSTPILGIDLGTTFSLGAVLQGGMPVVLPNALGELLTPSVVSVQEDGTLLVGAAALARSHLHPRESARWFKRDMGTTREYEIGGQRFRPEQLSALVLGEVKRGAEQALGQSVREAVVTVPAYFGELQRRATRDACAIAGLVVERIINEPTAAALAYGLSAMGQELRAVVLDLGGGTFDVTVLEIIEGVIEIQASAGDSRLGGEDFSDLVTREVQARIYREHGMELAAASAEHSRLREACDIAKRRLSNAEVARIALPGLRDARGRTASIELELRRQETEALFAALLARIEKPIRRALQDAHVAPDQVDSVLLVGGATRMPCVVELASKVFGRLPLRHLPPDEAVALGAAVQAALKAGDRAVDELVVTDVAPFSLGVATGQTVAGRVVGGLFSPIIDRGTVLPASRVETFHTMVDGQRQIKVEVYQGEHSLCADNQHLGSYSVKGIPAAPAGEQAIDVRFTYDLNGILEVDTTILATKTTRSLVLDRSPAGMSPSDIKRATQQMKHLKFHPRETLPNVTAIARAEAVLVNLIGLERAALLECLHAFRVALELQDPAQVELLREVLVARTLALRSGERE
ncbi:MAG TPA: Hsp70 family protein [Polyangiaceae bacterium]